MKTKALNKKIRLGFYQNNLALGGVGSYILTLVECLDLDRIQIVVYMRHNSDVETFSHVKYLRSVGAEIRWISDEGIPINGAPAAAGLPTESVEPLPPPQTQVHWRKKIVSAFSSALIPAWVKDFLFTANRIMRTSRAFAGDRLDVFHMNYGWYPSLAYITLGVKLSGVKRIVATAHNVSLVRRERKDAIDWVVHKLVPRSIDELILVSDRFAETMHLNHGFARDKIHVIHNAVDMKLSDTDPLLWEGGASQEKKRVVLVPARLSPEKGQAVLIRAAASLQYRFPGVRYLFAGQGADEPSLQALAAELGIQEKIEFLGHVNDMERLYAECDFVALPSLQEGFPYALLESARAMKPALATDVGGVMSMVGTAGGLIVRAGDVESFTEGLRRMLSFSATELFEMGRLFNMHVSENFSLVEMRQQTCSLFGPEFLGGFQASGSVKEYSEKDAKVLV